MARCFKEGGLLGLNPVLKMEDVFYSKRLFCYIWFGGEFVYVEVERYEKVELIDKWHDHIIVIFPVGVVDTNGEVGAGRMMLHLDSLFFI